MDNKKFGDFIKELRKEKQLTQKELGEKLNITDKAISKWERGLSFPDIAVLKDLAEFFEIDISELLNGERGKKQEIDIEKAIQEAIENYKNIEEKKKEKVQKVKKRIGVISIIIFVFALILQIVYLIIFKRHNYEYVIDALEYIINQIMILSATSSIILLLKKKKINGAVWLGGLLLAVIGILLQTNRSFFAKLGEEGAKSCCEKVLDFYLPGLSYSVKDETEWSFVEKVIDVLFYGENYEPESGSYQTQIESDLSYEAILAREAADENYVDEKTGEVIPSVGSADGTSLSDEKDAGGQTADAGAAENTGGQPAEPGVAENTGEQPAEADAAENQQAQIAEAGAADSQAASAVGDIKAVTFAREKLNDFDYLIQNFYQVDNTTTIGSAQLNADALLGKDVRLSHDASTPQILIYHTHSQEGYADSVPGDASMSVVGVGDYLTELLTQKYGFSVIHHTGQYDVGDRDHAYAKAGPALEQILAENKSIEVVIDLHRDGVGNNTRLVTEQNGVPMAQIMFFNGLSRTTKTGDIEYLYNPYIADNLAISFQMQLKAAEYYPGFTRRIYLKAAPTVHGIFLYFVY